MMVNLILHLRKEYFDQVKSGEKTREYREATDYWTKRLGSGTIDKIIVYDRFPKKDDEERILIFPWNGYILTSVLHKEFGPEPIFVYAIKLQGDKDNDH
jgi:hypothetical protein